MLSLSAKTRRENLRPGPRLRRRTLLNIVMMNTGRSLNVGGRTCRLDAQTSTGHDAARDRAFHLRRYWSTTASAGPLARRSPWTRNSRCIAGRTGAGRRLQVSQMDQVRLEPGSFVPLGGCRADILAVLAGNSTLSRWAVSRARLDGALTARLSTEPTAIKTPAYWRLPRAPGALVDEQTGGHGLEAFAETPIYWRRLDFVCSGIPHCRRRAGNLIVAAVVEFANSVDWGERHTLFGRLRAWTGGDS